MKTRTVDTSEQLHDRRNCKNFFHKKTGIFQKDLLCYKWECHSWVPEYLWEWWRVVWWWGRWVAVSAVVASGQQCDMNRARHSPDCQRECRQSSPYYTTHNRQSLMSDSAPRPVFPPVSQFVNQHSSQHGIHRVVSRSVSKAHFTTQHTPLKIKPYSIIPSLVSDL